MSFGKIFRQGKTGNGKEGDKKSAVRCRGGRKGHEREKQGERENRTGTKPRAGKLFCKIKKHSIDCAFHFADD